MEQVSFISHEADMTRMERMNRRLWILCIILLIMLLATNICWLVYEQRFEYYEITQDATDGGTNNYVGNDNNGEIINGTADD